MKGRGVGGSQQFNSALHPQSSAKGDSASVSRKNQQKLSKGCSWDTGQHPDRQGKSSVLGISNTNIYCLLNTLVETMHRFIYHFLFLCTQENYISQAPLKLDWAYFLAKRIWARH